MQSFELISSLYLRQNRSETPRTGFFASWLICLCVTTVMDVSTSAPSYITSIDDDDTGRIFDIACCQLGARAVTIVTAGLELKVWKQVPAAR